MIKTKNPKVKFYSIGMVWEGHPSENPPKWYSKNQQSRISQQNNQILQSQNCTVLLFAALAINITFKQHNSLASKSEIE